MMNTWQDIKRQVSKWILEKMWTNQAQLADKIVTKLQQNSAPGKCTWGDKYPEAYEELFKLYALDLREDVLKVLRSERSERDK